MLIFLSFIIALSNYNHCLSGQLDKKERRIEDEKEGGCSDGRPAAHQADDPAGDPQDVTPESLPVPVNYR